MHRDREIKSSPAGDSLTSLRLLAGCLDVPPPDDDSDEHQRWPHYQRAIPVETCHLLLHAAVSVDQNDALVAAVVVQMVERVDAPHRERWIGLARNERDRQYAYRRAREVDILRSQGAVSELSEETLSGWTDWLQIRLAEISTVVRTP
jgi:hypothetical protein